MAPVGVLDMSPEDQSDPERRVRTITTSQIDCQRASFLLSRREGISQREATGRVGVTVAYADRWSQRFDAAGITGLRDKRSRGRPSIPANPVENTRDIPKS